MRSYPSTRAKPTPPVFRVCLQCPKTFRTTNKEIQKGGGKFCSTACYRASRMGPRSPLAERFWSKVDKDGPVQPHCPDLGACWPWAAATQKVSGYGLVNVDGAIRLAHRVSWTLAKGPIPDGLDVLHRCDYRPCVRPDHLFLGDDAANMKDAALKDRKRVKLTIADVLEIRRRHIEDGEPIGILAASLGLSHSYVSQIISYTRRQHV